MGIVEGVAREHSRERHAYALNVSWGQAPGLIGNALLLRTTLSPYPRDLRHLRDPHNPYEYPSLSADFFLHESFGGLDTMSVTVSRTTRSLMRCITRDTISSIRSSVMIGAGGRAAASAFNADRFANGLAVVFGAVDANGAATGAMGAGETGATGATGAIWCNNVAGAVACGRPAGATGSEAATGATEATGSSEKRAPLASLVCNGYYKQEQQVQSIANIGGVGAAGWFATTGSAAKSGAAGCPCFATRVSTIEGGGTIGGVSGLHTQASRSHRTVCLLRGGLQIRERRIQLDRNNHQATRPRVPSPAGLSIGRLRIAHLRPRLLPAAPPPSDADAASSSGRFLPRSSFTRLITICGSNGFASTSLDSGRKARA